MSILLDFWKSHPSRGFHPSDQPFISASDTVHWRPEDVLAHPAAFALSNAIRGKLHPALFPQPFAGSLSAALVYILFGNPGFAIPDYEAELHRSDQIAVSEANLRGEVDDFAWLSPRLADSGPGTYWRTSFGTLSRELAARLHETPEESLSRISRHVCVIEAIPYHSYLNAPSGLEAMPSSQVALRFVREFVAPRALAGQCLLIVWRRARFWKTEQRLPAVMVRPSNKSQLRYLMAAERKAILEVLAVNSRADR